VLGAVVSLTFAGRVDAMLGGSAIDPAGRAAILPNIAPEDVEHVADKLRQVILASRITIDGIAIGVDASIGNQTLDENAHDQRAVMAKADAAMYQIKATAGR
jgi:GGDEF domain-containing protein